jgi:hypothetical protein
MGLVDVESVKNRSDKSILEIHSEFPDRFLAHDVSFPEHVKYLVLNVLNSEYSETIYKDLVSFTNLDTFVAVDVKLSSNLWSIFAHNSKCLRTLILKSTRNVFEGEVDDYQLNNTLEALLKIPTLKNLVLDNINLPYFPQESSNLEYIYINIANFDKQGSFDLSRHQNLKDVTIASLKGVEISDLNLENLKNLESLTIKCEKYNLSKSTENNVEKDRKYIRSLLDLPSVKKYNGLDVESLKTDKNNWKFLYNMGIM